MFDIPPTPSPCEGERGWGRDPCGGGGSDWADDATHGEKGRGEVAARENLGFGKGVGGGSFSVSSPPFRGVGEEAGRMRKIRRERMCPLVILEPLSMYCKNSNIHTRKQ